MKKPEYVSAALRKKLLPLKDIIVANFNAENWLEIGTLTDCLDLVHGHDRLLRSLRFGDDDYSGAALAVLIQILGRDSDNLEFLERYVGEKFAEGEPISTAATTSR